MKARYRQRLTITLPIIAVWDGGPLRLRPSCKILGVKLSAKRFDIEPELVIKSARLGARIYEVPISYHGRTYAEGKKIDWRDGVVALWRMLAFRFVG